MTQGIKPVSLEMCASLAEQLAANPADAVHQLPLLRKWLRELPPAYAELVSRPEWNAASLWRNSIVIENLEPGEDRVEVVRSQRDLWIRGCVAQAIPSINPELEDPDSADELTEALAQLRLGACAPSSQFRSFFDFNIRLDGSMGFFSRGKSGGVEIGAEGAAGSAIRMAKMDWRLETNQNIEIRVRNRSEQFGFLSLNEDGEQRLGLALRAVYVTFWGVELRGGTHSGPLLGGGSIGPRL